MWCRIALAGYDVVYVKTPQNSVRVHAGQTTSYIYGQGEYGSQLFECYRKVFDSIPSMSDTQNMCRIAAKWPVKVQLIYMVKSLIRGDGKMLAFHAKVFTRIFNWAGGLKVAPFLVMVLFDFMALLPLWIMRKLRVI